LHPVAETIHENFPLIDKLVSSVKKVFVKAPYRKEAFKAVAPSVPLPPEPILTRWGTWLCAASYYTEHLETVTNVVNTFDPKSAASIQNAQDVAKWKMEVKFHGFLSASVVPPAESALLEG
jgi:hypothetical protein